MRTIDITPHGIRTTLSRNQFTLIRGHPSKGAIKNWEDCLNQCLSDYRNEAPNRDYPLTPYQQWVILQVHRECGSYPPKTRLSQIREWIKQNRNQLRKENFENESV